MPLWDDECDKIVDRSLEIKGKYRGHKLKYRHLESLNRITDNNLPNGSKLITALYARMIKNWKDVGKPRNGSKENWRFEKRPEFKKNNKSSEVILERTIIKVMNTDDWANQIPVDSGIINRRSRYLDFAFRRKENTFDLIELKVVSKNKENKSDTALSAAIQILKYGLINAFFRIHSEQLQIGDLKTPLLSAKEIQLHVLAPKDYYDAHLSEEQIKWLRNFAIELKKGLKVFSKTQLNGFNMKLTDFQFNVFPDNFIWDHTKHSDGKHQDEVLIAVNGRQPL